ncbi:MAG: nitroreductase family protein [Prolixibacteraceae bacterium]|nr:nitroreductase family protein [Prolixibacteraceae bacterium]
MIKDLILKNRSYRRFYQNEKISEVQLRKWLELARLSASGRNAQPLKYILSNTSEKNEKIFQALTWAGFLKDWPGPKEGERPSAYLVQVLDTEISNQYYCDDGIAAQSILLGAVEDGYGGCILRAINKPLLTKALQIPEQFEIINVIALGKPKEKVVVEDMKDGDFKYWRDKNGVHHVPKRPVEELVVKDGY